MIGNKIILDTNIIIDLFRGNSQILNLLDTLERIDLPYVVLAELLLGAYRSSNREKHLSQIKGFLKKCKIIHSDTDTANIYALIKTELLKKGKPIPENDIWIAAIAQRHNLTLVTRDKHFKEVSGIKVKTW
ncbi:type II toxin-antitoxin system VapC family toxin [Olivibacter sp. SDN3]|uniref:type II toxin-antitoxin system VapC family toxin n=1 Tax=Olivibacter sp. SDN3 TaxID=2764720 RepID=UPI00165153D8|nr:type II toxin-antitoxin system VapC family toxin [Olivibacter sp. SDN3]QNL50596.1 type II toxin-antitoxin system VapC family toxin [Olivibacter sp. SDN3]